MEHLFRGGESEQPGPDEGLRELLLSVVPEPAPQPRRIAQVQRLVVRRRRRRAAATALASVAAGVLVVGALSLGDQPLLRVEQQPEGPVATQPAPTATGGDPSPSPHGVTAFGRPAGSDGSGRPRIGQASGEPSRTEGPGIFRTICGYSHMSAADPLTGSARTPVLRAFWGNTSADATIAPSVAGRGNSTCRGGILDRSVYWFVAVVDQAGRRAVAPSQAQVFYSTGYEGITPDQVEPIPAGLRMSAGQGTPDLARPGAPAVAWNCGESPVLWPAQRPDCAGATLYLRVIFPQCWDGRLDSPDHRSHLAYPQGGGCPASHPRALPEITYRLLYPAPVGGVANWHLAAVGAADPVAGFVNGWDPATVQRWTSYCLSGTRDCVGHLGGGELLIGDS